MTRILLLTLLLCRLLCAEARPQDSRAAAQRPPAADDADVRRGSLIAKAGFSNEDHVRDKLNDWMADPDAQAWLKAMNYSPAEIRKVRAEKPHGQKADVVVHITMNSGQKQTQGISIKLVSGESGFNQVDKRWLKSYAEMWNMPLPVIRAMKFYVGEDAPSRPSRRPDRMYLDELPDESRAAVVQFFTKNKRRVVEDLFAGDGPQPPQWFMVTQNTEDSQRWTLRELNEVVNFYAEGHVVVTRAGNLKIGRVSMQRKGGDNGRETANMLQFKINPVLLLDAP
ncbi:MAG: hypothetical protein R3C19_15175 [Planctomycetaceae bacterium]